MQTEAWRGYVAWPVTENVAKLGSTQPTGLLIYNLQVSRVLGFYFHGVFKFLEILLRKSLML